MKSVSFPAGLEKIELYAFSESGLESAVFPASLRTVAQGAFSKCKSLKSVTVKKGLEFIGTNDDRELDGVFQESALKSIILPKTLKRIEYSTFKKCTYLENITLSKGLEYVGKYCF